VHSFAESPIGPNYLAFLAVMLLASSTLYAWRANAILPSETDKVWGVSKESALMITQFLLLSFTTIVFIGTIFPVVSEAITNQKISIQAPYFNAFAPYIGAATMIAIGVGNLMHFQSTRITGGRNLIVRSLWGALPLAGLLMWLGKVHLTPHAFPLGAQAVGLYLGAWCMICLSYDFYLRVQRFKAGWGGFLKFNKGYIGAYFAHMGLLVTIIGFLGNYRGIDLEATLNSGESVDIYGYQLKFGDRMQIQEVENVTLFSAPLSLSRNGQLVTEMIPAQAKYPTTSERMNEIAVHSTLWHDVYVVLSSFRREDGKQVTLSIHINPTVRFVWIGVVLMVFGGLIGAFDRRRGIRSRDTVIGVMEESR